MNLGWFKLREFNEVITYSIVGRAKRANMLKHPEMSNKLLFIPTNYSSSLGMKA